HLLRRVAEVPGILRIRFTSPHPAEMSDRVIAAMAECPQVAPQVHLPVQSGADRVLERMERDYTVASYERLVERLRAAVPGIALSRGMADGQDAAVQVDRAPGAGRPRRRGTRARGGRELAHADGAGELSQAPGARTRAPRGGSRSRIDCGWPWHGSGSVATWRA